MTVTSTVNLHFGYNYYNNVYSSTSIQAVYFSSTDYSLHMIINDEDIDFFQHDYKIVSIELWDISTLPEVPAYYSKLSNFGAKIIDLTESDTLYDATGKQWNFFCFTAEYPLYDGETLTNDELDMMYYPEGGGNRSARGSGGDSSANSPAIELTNGIYTPLDQI